jgi:SCY1-like protein 2
MKTIHDLTDRVEEAHTKHLREVKSLEEQTHSVSSSSQVKNLTADSVDFETLLQGSQSTGNKPAEDMFEKMTSNMSVPPVVASWSTSSTLTPSNTVKQQSGTNKSRWTSSVPPLNPSNMTTQQTMTNNNYTKWNSSVPTLTSSNTLTPSNKLNQQTTTINNSQWNTSVPTFSSHTNESNGWKPSNSASTLKAIQPPQQSSFIPVMPMNQMSLNNGFNHSAFKSLSGNTTSSIPPLQPSNMKILQPTSSPSVTKNSPQKKIDIHAFDPLG